MTWFRRKELCLCCHSWIEAKRNHPEYRFEEEEGEEDAANYSNRSPYPMLHLLREESVEKAVSSYEGIDEVPENNIRLLREMGIEKILKMISN